MLTDHALREELDATLDGLVRVIGPRAPGSGAEKKAAAWIEARFQDAGLKAWTEDFPSPEDGSESAELKIGGVSWRVWPLQFSPVGRAHGPLVFLGNEEEAARVPVPVGAIGILMPMADLFTRQALLRRLEAEGLAAVVVVSPLNDHVNTKIVRDPTLTRMPVITLSYADALHLKTHEGKVATVHVHGEPTRLGVSQNVVAELPGSGPHWMAVFAHYDSAAQAPGATDNGAAVAALLAIARRLKVRNFPATIYLVATGSEEFGGEDLTGRGSLAFFSKRRAHLAEAIALVDIDDIGNRLGTATRYAAGPKPFIDKLGAIPQDRCHLLHRLDVSGGGDNGGAYQYGVPYVWYYDNANRPYYHTPADDRTALDLDRVAAFVPDIEKTIGALAACKPFFPHPVSGDLLVRPARFEDLDAVEEVTRLAFGEVSLARMQEAFFGEKPGGKDWHAFKGPEVRAQLKRDLYRAVVAEKEGRVVGYATWHAYPGKELAEIGNNAVHPDYQGKGIGKAMQAEISRRMDEEGFVKRTVSTLTHDTAAQKVYEKLGYERYAGSVHYLKRVEKPD
ncbi:MAG: GNAT family N-acetyltransferase [Spirochaetes bacterium]|nr:GNAT family N-acetyltransferase [Spirochaetota bacterium]